MDFKKIEKEISEFWEKHPDLYKADDGSKKEKKYILVEFPYPSGSGLHVGHTFTFTGGDVYARFKRMQGYNVLFPMGWDAFGLPTENYAIKMKKKPQTVTKENTDAYRREMKRLAFSFDWEREVNTTDPNYYKWTQWIFIKLFEKGLAYKQEMPINWCPSCKIGLANEEVVDGKCERCHTETTKRNISQWVIKITKYADRLIEGLERTEFVEKVKKAQINWIGKKEGLTINFKVENSDLVISCFTKYPETIFGVSWVVVSPEYPDLDKLVTGDNKSQVESYKEQSSRKSELDRTSGLSEKTGVFTGSYVINPVNNKRVPIWVGDYVLANFGTGAVMGVAPHDSRDFMFAKKYDLEMLQVEIPEGNPDYIIDSYEKVIEDGLMINSGQFNGMKARSEAYKAICDWMVENGWAERKTEYHLRDWIFSRQHYWGEPIPMVFCEKCAHSTSSGQGWFPVPEEQLPIKLPEVEAYEPTDTGESPLAKIESFVNTTCPKCGGKAKRETDTMPNWAGSDWYFLRYLDNKNDKELASIEKQKYWMPVDVYFGGDEHTTLHLLYSRFVHKFLYDLPSRQAGIGVATVDEPYIKRVAHGVILGPDGQRMSKSRGNVIVPGDVTAKFGVDVIRCYVLFMGPYDGTMAWNEKTLMGVKRFLDRFEKFISSVIARTKDEAISTGLPRTAVAGLAMTCEIASNSDVELIINKTVKGVTDDIENFGYNTAIAKLMGMLNELWGVIARSETTKQSQGDRHAIARDDVVILIKLIAPFAPYLSEELWSRVRSDSDPVSVHKAGWPKYDRGKIFDENIVVPVAVNGKVRDQLSIVNCELRNEREIIKRAKELEKIKGWIEGKMIIKEIYVPNKMINFVIK